MWLINLLFKKRKKEELRNKVITIVAKDSLRTKTTDIVTQDRVESKKDKPVIRAVKKIIAHVVKLVETIKVRFKNIRRIQVKGEISNDEVNC